MTNAIGIVAAVVVTLLAMLAPAQSAEPAPRIHVVSTPPFAAWMNAYLVETPEGVIAIDSALRLTDAKALAARIDALGKPLVAVIVTHGHPDHYAKNDAVRAPAWKARYKDEWPDLRAVPNRTVRDGESMVLGGVRFTVRALGPGESNADSYWRIDSDGGHAFIGDVVMAQAHAYTLDGHTAQWLRTIARLESELGDVRQVHPGHGPSGGLELLRWQRDYLVAYRAEVEALRAGRDSLDDAARKTLTENMRQRYRRLPLEFLIGFGANAVARELAGEGK